jgi:hypothetical protein
VMCILVVTALVDFCSNCTIESHSQPIGRAGSAKSGLMPHAPGWAVRQHSHIRMNHAMMSNL